ncbi:hypothetical protein PVK06_008554 [Gossypium arboreum]|uniref:Uncharacterized protein n=1 Tax=Gossypium arboreum TaxID=29729 RepID=A0ABR0QLF8_GOSAR|nr:hypothetical protein PVK06_008554 [Gossypium arboreum]
MIGHLRTTQLTSPSRFTSFGIIATKSRSIDVRSILGVSEESINKFHLHYLPKERQFTLVGKGNPSPLVPQGKEGECYKAFQSPLTYLNVCDYIVDMVNCHSLINGDMFVLNDGKESITNENCGADEHVGEVTLNMGDSECSYKHSNFYDCGDNVHSLTCCAKPTCVYKPVQMRLVFVDFVVNGGMKSCLLGVLCIEKSVVDVGLIQHMQTLDVCVKGYSHSKLDLFDYDGFMERISSFATFSCISMFIQMKCDRFDYLNGCLFISSLFRIFKSVPNPLLYFFVDTLKWPIQKEEGHVADVLSFQDVFVHQVVVSQSIPFSHQRSYDDVYVVLNKWLDLRTSCFEEGDDVSNPPELTKLEQGFH